MALDIVRIAEKLDVQGIWFVLHGSIARIAASFRRKSQLPMHVTVHDDPPYATFLRSYRMLWLSPWVARDLGFVLKSADSVDVVCKEMGDYYQRKFGIDSTIIHRAVAGEILESNVYSKFHDQGIRIGVLGNTYGYASLQQLARALVAASEIIGKKSSLLICGQSFGNKLMQEFSGQLNLEVTGHVSEFDGIELMKSCTALYLNYPFGQRDQVLRETSFPTKLSTYIAAARPLFIHCPPNSSILKIGSQNSIVEPWTSTNIGDGSKHLVAMWNSPKAISSFHQESENLRQLYFDGGENPSRIIALLNRLG